jgi:hypothetical protein
VLLYTRLSAEQARAIERGEGFPPVDLFFADRPLVVEASADSVWVAIDVPDAKAAAFETAKTPELGYREFVLDGSDAARYRVWLMDRVREEP